MTALLWCTKIWLSERAAFGSTAKSNYSSKCCQLFHWRGLFDVWLEHQISHGVWKRAPLLFIHKQRPLKALALSLGGAAKTSLIFQRLLICLSLTGREHTSALKVENAVTSWFLQALFWNLGASLLNLLFKGARFKLNIQVDSASVSALHMYVSIIKWLHISQQQQILIDMILTPPPAVSTTNYQRVQLLYI